MGLRNGAATSRDVGEHVQKGEVVDLPLERTDVTRKQATPMGRAGLVQARSSRSSSSRAKTCTTTGASR
jgi:hypothetical protein